MTWVLAYLLAGFVLHWIAIEILRLPASSKGDWKVELAATLLWPLTLIAGLVHRGTTKR